MTESTTLKRVHDAKEAIASAQSAMDKAQRGLSAVETVAEKADTARRHPMRTVAVLLGVAGLIALAASLMGGD